MIITKEDKKTMDYLLSLKKVQKSDVIILQGFMNKYIDKHCKICNKCGGQIRFSYNRFKNWVSTFNPKVEEEIKQGEILCIQCNNVIHDKRRKDFCSDDCKKDFNYNGSK